MRNKLGCAAEDDWPGASRETATVAAAIELAILLAVASWRRVIAVADDARTKGRGSEALIAGMKAMTAADRRDEQPHDDGANCAADRFLNSVHVFINYMGRRVSLICVKTAAGGRKYP
jgi:hypothetical protein